jgi:hypothetical protein
MSGNLVFNYDITDYLPAGLTLGDPEFDGSVTMTAYIAPIEVRTFDISVANISVQGEIEGLRIFVDDTEYETVSLTLQGLGDNINAVDEDKITGTVSVEEILENAEDGVLAPGTYSADVTWQLPDGVTAKGIVSVYVTVEENS